MTNWDCTTSVPLLRDSQRETVECVGGTGFVYPRGRAAHGKRVIYFLDGVRVKVCELFLHHDQYDAARARGFDLSEYCDFAPWESPTLVSA